MPRAFDRGTPPQDHNPLHGLLDFNNIDDVVKLVGGSVFDFVIGIRDGIVAFIYTIAGINLASWDDFLASLMDGKGIDLPWVVTGLSQLLEILRGNVVTPISEAVAGVQDWWNGVQNSFQEAGDRFQDFTDNLWRGFSRLTGGGKSIADVANAASSVSTQADTSMQLAEWTNAILGIRNNAPLWEGIDSTEESNFPMTDMMVGASPPAVINATAANVPISFWLAPRDAKKGFISWHGQGLTDIVALYIDVYRLNYETSTMELIHTSPDQVPNLSATWKYMNYQITTADRIDVAHGEMYGVAWRVVGTGTHQIAGKAASWMPGHQTLHPAKMAASRTGFGDLAFGSIVYSGDMPWFGIGIVEGDVPPPYFAPRTTPFTEVGTFVYDVPTWANFVDGIYSAAGGGGSGGNVVAGGYGEGGKKGQRIGETLVRGVDFPDVLNAQITVTVGNGGHGGDGSGDGGTGGDTYRHAIVGGKAEARAVGGDPGTNNFVGYDQGPARGQHAGTFTWNGIDYAGGTGGTVGAARSGGTGGSPSAGGGGGSGGTYGVSWDGGRGGRGDATFVARQD